MLTLDRLASAMNRKDEQPNIELAQEIASTHDNRAIDELVAGLRGNDRALQIDAIKVLYEAGSIDPNTIADHADLIIDLLQSKQNRLVWGAMHALGTIAPGRGDLLSSNVPEILEATRNGSVITKDWGVRVLAQIASEVSTTRNEIEPYLLDELRACKAKDLPKHAESCQVLAEGDPEWAAAMRSTLEQRTAELSSSQLTRVRRFLRTVDSLE